MKFTKEVQEMLVKMHTEGAYIKDMAANFDVTETAVRGWLKKLGLKHHPVLTPLTDWQQSEILRLHNIPMDAVKIAKEVGTTQHRVLKHLRDNGKDTYRAVFNEEQVNSIIADYYAGFTFEMLEEKYDAYQQNLRNIFKRKGVKLRTKREVKQNSWYVWEDAFKDMTDERSLFFYGLLLSDGCMTSRGSVTIQLQARDSDVLEKFREYLKIEKDLSFSKATTPTHQDKYTLAFMDEVVYKTLSDLGLSPRKSLKETLPNCEMTIEQARHFWRGCIAGDGCVSLSGGKYPRIHLCGSEELCTAFSEFIKVVVGLKEAPPVYYTQKPSGKKVYNTRISCSKAVDLGDFLYKDSTVNLQRKYETYLKFKDYSPKFTHKKCRVTSE